jgi:hypothetical protein
MSVYKEIVGELAEIVNRQKGATFNKSWVIGVNNEEDLAFLRNFYKEYGRSRVREMDSKSCIQDTFTLDEGGYGWKVKITTNKNGAGKKRVSVDLRNFLR